jgi:integrase/recombinase XerD
MTSTHTPAWRSTPPVALLAAAWVAGYSCSRTRRTYQAMIRSWLDWCAECAVEPLAARRAHVELWQRSLEQHGYAARTVALKLTAVASFYRYCQQEDLLAHTPMACVRRPRVERLSPRGALSRGQVHDLLAAAERLGVHAYGLCCVLALNGLRIGEATGLNVEDLDYDGLYPVLAFTRKGGRPARAVLARPTEAAVTACIGDRGGGPLFLNRAGRRLDQRAAVSQPGRTPPRSTGRPADSRPLQCQPPRPPRPCHSPHPASQLDDLGHRRRRCPRPDPTRRRLGRRPHGLLLHPRPRPGPARHHPQRRRLHPQRRLTSPAERRFGGCPVRCVTGRDGHGQLAASMRSP